MITEWNGVIHFLTGFENNGGSYFNFILSNGARSTQIDKNIDYHTHMIPSGSLKIIRKVHIHHGYGTITGFSFFDEGGVLLYEIGRTGHGYK